MAAARETEATSREAASEAAATATTARAALNATAAAAVPVKAAAKDTTGGAHTSNKKTVRMTRREWKRCEEAEERRLRRGPRKARARRARQMGQGRRPGMTHRRWNKLMHIMLGNGDAIRAVMWNTMQLAAGKESAKRAWLEEQLETYRPAVVFLLEVSGDFGELKKMRRWATKLKYEARFIVGEDRGPGGSVKNGVVALAAKEQAAFKHYVRLEERTIGVVVAHKVDASTRAYVGVHGLHDKSKLTKQLTAAERFEWHGASAKPVPGSAQPGL